MGSLGGSQIDFSLIKSRFHIGLLDIYIIFFLHCFFLMITQMIEDCLSLMTYEPQFI